MDYRTRQEVELHTLVTEVMEAMTNPKLGREKFPHIMGSLRDIKVRLDNLQSGCLTGKHASECLCEHGIEKTMSWQSKQKAVSQ